MDATEGLATAEQVAEIKAMLARVLERLETPATPRTMYSVDEAAKLLGRSSYTVREWCREGRIFASKRQVRRGGADLWAISASEIERITNEGLLSIHRRA